MSEHELKEKLTNLKFKSGIVYNLIKDLLPNQIKLYKDVAKSENFTIFFNDEESISLVLSFLENNLNISETAKHVFMHRNTLIYRLDKITKLTGLDIRKFDDAMTMYILLVINFKENNSAHNIQCVF